MTVLLHLLLWLLGGAPVPRDDECAQADASALLREALDAAGGEVALSRIDTEDFACTGFFREPTGNRAYSCRYRTRRDGAHRFDMATADPPHQMVAVATAALTFFTVDGAAREPDDDFFARTRASPRANPVLNLLLRHRRGDRTQAWRGCMVRDERVDVLELCATGSLCDRYYLDPGSHSILAVEDGRTFVRILGSTKIGQATVATIFEGTRRSTGRIGLTTCKPRVNVKLPPELFTRDPRR